MLAGYAMILRPKQNIVLSAIRQAYVDGYNAPCVVAPCGFGKTVLFSAMAKSAEDRGKYVLIICHRIELVDQIVATLEQFGVYPDIIAASYTRSAIKGRRAHVTVASVQTLVRRLNRYPSPTLMVIDECHHALARTWAAIPQQYPTAKLLGVTASPIRADGRGLGTLFDTLIPGPSVKELTAEGWLAPVRIFAPPTVDTSGLHIRAGDYKQEESEALMDAPSITGSALSHYRQHANGLPALTFCTSVKHAHNVAEQFRKDNIAAFALDGGTDKQIRRMAVQDFRDGKIKVISQCEIATEGWDLPGVHCGIFLRPTQSLGLWIQMTGRCSRISPGKTHAILLDHCNNTRRMGMPDEDRDWILTVDTVKRKKKDAPLIRVCPQCFAASPARTPACIECGHVFEVKSRQEIEEKDGELVELTAEQIARKRERRQVGMTKDLRSLIELGRQRGYRNPERWAQFVYDARVAKRAKRNEFVNVGS